jgi:hypothetical protein
MVFRWHVAVSAFSHCFLEDSDRRRAGQDNAPGALGSGAPSDTETPGFTASDQRFAKITKVAANRSLARPGRRSLRQHVGFICRLKRARVA